MSASLDRAAASPFRLIIPPDLSRVAEVRGWLATVAGRASFDETRTFDLQVAVSEAVANAIEHAASEVEIEAWLLVDRLLVEVTNNGAFRPGLYKDDEHRRRGLGLPLMVSLADQVHVSRLADSRTRVSLSFHFGVPNAVRAQATEEGPASVLARLEEESLKVAAASSRAALLADLLDRASQPFGVGLPEGGLALFNTAYADLLGYTKDELAALDWSEELTPPEWRRFEEEQLSELVRTGTPVRYEEEYFRKDGTRVPVELLVHVVRDDAGAPLYYYSFITDLSERRRAEAALRKSESTLRAIQDAATESILLLSADGVILAGNATAVHRMGRPAEEIIGRPMADVLSPDLARARLARLGQVAESGQPLEFEDERDGLTFVHTFYPIFDREGRVERITSFSRDITERQKVARELESASRRYRALFDNSSFAVTLAKTIFDAEGRPVDAEWVEVNRMYGPFTGLSPEELVGRRVTEVIPGVDRALIDRHNEVALTGQPSSEEFFEPNLGRWFRANFYSPEYGYYLSLLSDVTAEKEAEAEREQLLVQEQELSEELAAANEELQAQTAELAAANEELQAQAEELAAEEEELHVQNEELIQVQTSLAESSRLSQALNHVNESLNSTLEFSEVLQRVIREGARALGAERAVLEIREEDGWVVQELLGLPEKLRGLHLSDDEASVATAMAQQREVLAIEDSRLDRRVNMSTVLRYETTAALIMPVVLRGEVLGSLQFIWTSGRRAFSPAEVDFTRKLSGSLAFALENARLFETQRTIARQLQQTILEMPSRIPRLRFSHLYRSATEDALVGGDFYDAFELEDGSIAIQIGDVSGHGINAARVATMVKASLIGFTHRGSDPGDVLSLVNDLLLRKSVPGFTSLLFAVFHPEAGTLTYCSAGHPGLLLRNAAGDIRLLEANRSAPLGVFPDWSCLSDTVKLEAGDTLLLYTDGVTEARRSGELFGEDRLAATFKSKLHLPISELPQALLDDVLTFTGGRLQDDLAILAVEPLDEDSDREST